MVDDTNPTPDDERPDAPPADERPDDSSAGSRPESSPAPERPEGAEGSDLSPEDLRILDDAERDLVAEMREDMLRAQAELVNFRNRVERDRQVNREATIAEVLRALLPALDDLDRAEAHGDAAEGTPMGLVTAKLRGAFERFGLTRFGEVGEAFDPAFHEAMFQQPTPGAESETILDVIERGYRFGDRVVRAAKVAVSVPERD